MQKSAALPILFTLLMPGLVQAAERPATKAEILKIAVGHTVSNAMYYGADGRYTYKGGSPGRYQVSDGRICVVFDSGTTRCDQILKDGDAYFLITAQGRRSPFMPN
jgi:hypothetical protein